MQCAHCATPVPEDAVYCHQCGSLVSDAEGQAAITASMDDSAIRHLTDLLREDTQGDYEIIRQLGRGGMAVVYLAKEIELHRQVAIKALPPAVAAKDITSTPVTIVLAFFAEYLDHSIKTPEEAEEKMQLPTLVSIPRVRGVRARKVYPMVKR